MTAPIPFTAAAFKKIQDEFDRLTAERVEVMKRLQIAREMGDLSENGAYTYAKFELGSIGRQLRTLTHLLKHGQVVAPKKNYSTVDFGCVVTIQDPKGRETTYTIVSIHESDPVNRKLSTDSPIGAALMGQPAGAHVTVTTPRGPVEYTILDISSPQS
jgi:transcription elongation factor GreA